MHAQVEDVMKAEDAFFSKAFRIIDSHQRTRWKHLYKILMEASRVHGKVEWDAFPGWDISKSKGATVEASPSDDTAHVNAILRMMSILLDVIATSDSTNPKFHGKLEKLAELAFEVWAIRRTRNLQQVRDVEGFIYSEEDRVTITWKTVSDTLHNLTQLNSKFSSANTTFFKFVKTTGKLFLVLVVFVFCMDKFLWSL